MQAIDSEQNLLGLDSVNPGEGFRCRKKRLRRTPVTASLLAEVLTDPTVRTILEVFEGSEILEVTLHLTRTK